MYIIESYTINNGKRAAICILKPVEVRSIADIDKYQQRLQKRIQAKRKHTVQVLVNYKVPIPEHIPHNNINNTLKQGKGV